MNSTTHSIIIAVLVAGMVVSGIGTVWRTVEYRNTNERLRLNEKMSKMSTLKGLARGNKESVHKWIGALIVFTFALGAAIIMDMLARP